MDTFGTTDFYIIPLLLFLTFYSSKNNRKKKIIILDHAGMAASALPSQKKKLHFKIEKLF